MYEMKIREKIKEIDDAIELMLHTDEYSESFHDMKHAVVEKIHETEEAADVMLGQKKTDLDSEIVEKMREVREASETLMSQNDHESSKETGGRIRELLHDIKEAAETLTDDRMNK